MMKKIFILILVLIIVVSMLAMLVECSSSDNYSDSSSTSVQTNIKCFACGKRATKIWRDGRCYCNKCYAYLETIWENS